MCAAGKLNDGGPVCVQMARRWDKSMYFNLIILACVLAQVGPSNISFEEAIEIVRSGRMQFPGDGSDGQDPIKYWEAAQQILATAKREPDRIAQRKEIVISEVERLNLWDHYTEVSGEYKLSLIKALFEIEDPTVTDFFLGQCQHGSFVTEGLARIGRPAVDAIIRELLHGRHKTCAQIALVEIAKLKLGLDSDLSQHEMDLLRRDLIEKAVPAFRQHLRTVRRFPERYHPYATASGRERLAELQKERLVELA